MDVGAARSAHRLLSVGDRRPPGMRSTRASGRAATPKPAPSAATIHHPYRHSHGQPIVAGWNYSWLVQVPLPLLELDGATADAADAAGGELQPGSRRTDPLLARSMPHPPQRTLPGLSSASMLATTPSSSAWPWPTRRSACWCACAPAAASTPTRPAQLPTGRPRRHGAKFVCDDPTTWPAPTGPVVRPTDPQYGHVQLQAWSGLHPISAAACERGTRTQPHARPLVRGTLDPPGRRTHLPRPTKAPQPALVLVAGPRPTRSGGGLAGLSRPLTRLNTPSASSSRPCKWTTPKLRRPEAADRWTWLLLSPMSSCAWPATRCRRTLALAATPAARAAHSRPRPARLFVRSGHSWAVPPTYQNPADARRDDPKVGAQCLLSAFQRSNSRPKPAIPPIGPLSSRRIRPPSALWCGKKCKLSLHFNPQESADNRGNCQHTREQSPHEEA